MRLWHFVFILAALLVMPVSGLAEEGETPPTIPGVKNVNADQVKSWLDEGEEVFLLDVRKTSDFEAGHLPDAENLKVPLDLNISDEAIAKSVTALAAYEEIKELAKNTIIVTYCNSAS